MSGITVFTKHGCKYCVLVKKMLEKKHIPVTYIYIDEQEDIDASRAELLRLMGEDTTATRVTMPQIFFGTTYQAGGATALLEREEKKELVLPESTTTKPSPIVSSEGGYTWKYEVYDPTDF
jgi:glutaredoxin